MTKEEIEDLFKKTIDSKGIGKKANLSKQVIYNYRHRPTISFGDKIEFLMNINLITIEKNESASKA